MRLGCEFAQRHLGTFQGLALGAEGGVAQTGRRVAWIKAFAAGVTAKAAAFASGITTRFTTGIGAGTAVHARASVTPTPSGVFAVAKFAGAARIGAGGFAFHAGAVIAAHGDHAFGRGFGCNHFSHRGCGRAFCCIAGGLRGVCHFGLATLLWAGAVSGRAFGVCAFGRHAFGCGSFGHSGVYRRCTGLGHRISHRLHLRLLGAGCAYLGLRLGLALQGGFQSGNRAADQLRVAASIGCLQGFGRVNDHAVTLAQ